MERNLTLIIGGRSCHSTEAVAAKHLLDTMEGKSTITWPILVRLYPTWFEKSPPWSGPQKRRRPVLFKKGLSQGCGKLLAFHSAGRYHCSTDDSQQGLKTNFCPSHETRVKRADHLAKPGSSAAPAERNSASSPFQKKRGLSLYLKSYLKLENPLSGADPSAVRGNHAIRPSFHTMEKHGGFRK